jgi:hypothetical protein
MPWCSVEEYKKRADAISKTKAPADWKAWHPAGKGMPKKWEGAFEIAQSTVGMTRRERYEKFIAHYVPPHLQAARSHLFPGFLTLDTPRGAIHQLLNIILKLRILVLLPVSTLTYVVKVKNYS